MTRRPLIHSHTAAWLWALSALFIVYGTSIPFQFTTEPGFAAAKLARVPLNLLVSPETGRRASIPDMVQNVLLFVPFGLFGMLAIGWRTYGLWRVAVVTVMAACLSVGVEVLQLFTTDRTSSLNDLMTNTSGALLGAVCAPIAGAILARVFAMLRTLGLTASEAAFPLLVAFAALVIAAWHPYDASLDIGNLIPKMRALVADPWQFDVVSDEGLDFLRSALFGVALVAWLRQIRSRRPVLTSVVIGVALVVALEAAQFVIRSRMPGLKDLVVQSAGLLIGSAMAPWAMGQATPIPGTLIVIVATWVAAAVQMLSPFALTKSPAPFEWFPFLAYYQFTSTQTVSHVVELSLMFFPVGFLLALANQGSSVGIGALITMLVLVIPLEYAQGWIVGRFPDITDIGVAVIGGLAGAWVGRAGYRRYRSEMRTRPPARTKRPSGGEA